MRKFTFLISGLILFISITGCTTVKRFRTADYKGEDNSLVDVTLFSTRLSVEPLMDREKDLWTLSANAQTRMVQILDERFPGNLEFLNALAGTYTAKEVQSEDLTKKDLRMVFTVQKSRDYSRLNDTSGRFSPADRIEYLKISLKIPEFYNLRFLEWNRYATEYGEIDLADVSFSRNLDLSLEGSPGGIDAGYDMRVGRSERQVVRKQYLKMNGNLSDHLLEIESEGTREADLTGNVMADISLAFAGFPEKVMIPLFSDSVENDPGSEFVSLKFVDMVVPAMKEAPDTILADLSLEYIYRHAAAGWKTFAEWDDRVEYYRGHAEKKVVLFLKKDYLPGLFCIGSDQGVGTRLKLRNNLGTEYLLEFRDRHDAGRLLQWLQSPSRDQHIPVILGDNSLLYKGDPVTPGEILKDQLRVLPVY